MSTTISVVLFQRDKWWIAQCLQYDIGAQAHSLPDVLYELERTLVGYLTVADELNIEPFVHLDPAPDFYWKKFQGTLLTIEPVDAPMRVPMGHKLPQPQYRIAG